MQLRTIVAGCAVVGTALLAVAAAFLTAVTILSGGCVMRDARFDGVPQSHFLGRTEADITNEYGAPAWSRWVVEFDTLDAPGGCEDCGPRIQGPGQLQLVDGRARLYFIGPAWRDARSKACEACFSARVAELGELACLRRLYAESGVRAAWREITYRVQGDGVAIFDQTFRARFDLNGNCVLAGIQTE